MIGVLGRVCQRRPIASSASLIRSRSPPLNAASTSLLRSRYSSTISGHSPVHPHADELRHIQAGPNEAIFYVDNLFPLRWKWLSGIPFADSDLSISNRIKKRINLPDFAAAEPLTVIERAFPSELRTKITEVIPRLDEGGAFVKFIHDPEVTRTQLEEWVKNHLEKNPIKPWYNPFWKTRAMLVRGRPWIVDLYRVPSSRLKVEFLPTFPEASAAELTQETLYSLARRYGKLMDIVAQPSDSKVLPRYAFIEFDRLRYAVTAKNCLDGYKVSEVEGGGKSGTLLKITYEQKPRGRWIRDSIFNHPRIVIPIIAALIAAITVTIFDPIRTFFIKIRIKPPIHLHDNIVWQWLQRQADKANEIILFGRRRSESNGLKAVWEDRKNDIQLLKSWLLESGGTFIIVHGPRGSGKKELILDEVLKDRKSKLVIDCKAIQEANGDSATINAAAAEVGYRPVFSWLNSVSSVIDLAVQGTFGTKAGFSETLDAQLGKILQNTASAMKKVALDRRRKDDKDADLNDEEYLEAHPEYRPVVVINNFLHKTSESPMIYERIADWAAIVVCSNVAHVIFLTADASASMNLSKALPNQVFHQISLRDCSPEVAKRFVLEHIRAHGGDGKVDVSEIEHMSDLDTSLKALGGRLTDLEFLARMIKGGATPNESVLQIINEASAEVLKMFIIGDTTEKRPWSPEQVWFLISKLGETESGNLRYNEVLLHDLFKTGGESAIQALEQAELISITTANGRPSSINPGRPVYHAAFRRLTSDKVLASRLGLATLRRLIAMENQNIQKYEGELQVLGSLPKQPSETWPRIKWLLGKLGASQSKVEKYETEVSSLKKVLEVEY
ncbi:mitochondrial escape protein 2 [Onygenales sp. PD_12]|nr:mitochondrial escape protein 2 [Emmonsiellopsis sp. PD_33]KAK2795432.1 mitochondrial escape protein 2 [Onygenales sp. PD_12]